MRFRNIDKWTNIDNMRGLLFFVQRLDELTYPYTLDSYKSSAVSLQGLIAEGISLIKEGRIEKDGAEKTLNSLENIIEEIKVRIKGNWFAKKICSLDIDELLSEKRDVAKLDLIARQLFVIGSELNVEAYVAEIADNVIQLSGHPKQKQKLEFLAREFASFLQSRGVSRDHINNSVSLYFFGENEINNPLQFKIFCQTVYPHYHNFSVIVGVSDAISEFDSSILHDYKMIVINDEMNGLDHSELDLFRNEQGYECLVYVVVTATDYNSALSEALKSLDAVRNFYRIFSHKEEISFSRSALVEQGCCEGIKKKVDTPRNNMFSIRDMRSIKASSTLKRFNESITLDGGPDSIKFRNIINIHGMSLESKSEDIQLVNLWTCLETIAPGNQFGSKISNVVNRVIPVLMLAYYNRIVVNLLFDIIRWDRRSFTESLKLAKINPSHDLKKNFVALITEKENESALGGLYTRCRDFELLRFRIASISAILSDPKKAREKLQAHEEMVKWQLHRIYRSRNKIVHSSESPVYTNYLVESAHDYFDQVLLFCLELSAWKGGFNTFLSCFDYAEYQYREYKKVIKSATGNKIIWTLPDNKDGSFIFASHE